MPLNSQGTGLCKGKGKGSIPTHCRAAAQAMGTQQTEAKLDNGHLGTHTQRRQHYLSVGAFRWSSHPIFEFISLFTYIK